MKTSVQVIAVGFCVWASACSVRTSDQTSGFRSDGSVNSDGGGFFTDGSVNPCVPGCGPEELCGMGDGNGLDDNCNGQVDEICSCTSGTTRPCFQGSPDRRGIGACTDGIQSCSEIGTWSGCLGGVSPTAETCDGTDNDCNGITDDGLNDCSTAVQCPGNERTRPLSTHVLVGDRVYSGNASAWNWRLECPPTVEPSLCPQLSSSTAENPEVYFTQSGAYRVNVSVTLEDGNTSSCAWSVIVAGDGLRVELNWDTLLNDTDGDLHLHQFTNQNTETDYWTADDCHYGNCKPSGRIDWGLPNTALENCQNAPQGAGAAWVRAGSCRNPRLDVDVNAGGSGCDANASPTDPDFCGPENINVDNPVVGKPYRIMVDNYSNQSGVGMKPEVNIYCGGALRATLGSTTGSLLLRNREKWNVADVVFVEGQCGAECVIYPLGESVTNERTFGAPWSCTYDEVARTCTAR